MGEGGGNDRVVGSDGGLYCCLVKLRSGVRLRERGCELSEFSEVEVLGMLGSGAGLPFCGSVFASFSTCGFRSVYRGSRRILELEEGAHSPLMG